MEKIKWVVCDLDGTLLKSDSTLSTENIEAIKDLMDKDINVILATGRLDLMAKEYINKLNIKCPVISCNGGLIRNPVTEEILFKKLIHNKFSKEIILFCLSNDIDFLIYTPYMVYFSKNNYRINHYILKNETIEKEFRIPLEEFNEDTFVLEGVEIVKILLFSEFQDRIDELALHFSSNLDLEVVSSSKGLLDIMARGVTKGNGLKILKEKINLDFSTSAAFGDNYNDISMLELVSLPITMENGETKVKDICKYISLSNDDNGVAHGIYKKILI